MTYALSGFGCPGQDCMCNQLGTIAYNTTPHSDWTCAEWMFWHKALVTAFQDGRLGKYSKAQAIEYANSMFATAWDNVIPWWSAKLLFSSCSYGSDFVNYFKSVGYTDHISFIGAGVSSGAEAVVNVADTISEASETTKNTASVLKWLIPTVLIGGVAIGGYYVYKHYAKGNERVKIKGKTI